MDKEPNMNKAEMLSMIITITVAAPIMLIYQPVIAQNMTGTNATSVNTTGVGANGTSVIFKTFEECTTSLTDNPPRSASGIPVSLSSDQISIACKAVVGHPGTYSDVSASFILCTKVLADVKNVNVVCNLLHPSE
jgi:hypothetical protein